MIWGTVSSWFCSWWLYRASPSLAAKKYNQSDFSIDHLVMSLCSVFFCVVQKMCLLWPVHYLGFPAPQPLPELAQTHVHYVSDAIQPSQPLLSTFPPAFNLSQHQVFSNESALPIRWPKYWSFSFSTSSSNVYSGLISFSIDWFYLLAVQRTPKGLFHTKVQMHQFFSAQPSYWFNSQIYTRLLEKP